MNDKDKKKGDVYYDDVLPEYSTHIGFNGRFDDDDDGHDVDCECSDCIDDRQSIWDEFD